MKRLIFVYNADSGIGNSLLDTAHKYISPKTYKCNLCLISYGAFGMKKDWKKFVEGLPVKAVFLHKDEFLERYSPEKEVFPGLYYLEGSKIYLIANLAKIGQKEGISGLKNYVTKSLKKEGLMKK